jgi:hypothetical protein
MIAEIWNSHQNSHSTKMKMAANLAALHHIVFSTYGSSGRTRIINQTYFQQHVGQRMTHKTMKSSRNPINRAHLERVFASSVL